MERAKALKVSAGTDPRADLGPVISKQVRKGAQNFTNRPVRHLGWQNNENGSFHTSHLLHMYPICSHRQRNGYAD